jgi:DNA-binding beta-propeller fold protein YncE
MRITIFVAAILTSSVVACSGGGDDDPPGGPDGGAPVIPCDTGERTDGVSTVAGCELAGASDGDREVARFNNPVNVAIGNDGTIYVADFDNDRVRRVSPDGEVSTLTYQARFQKPFGLAFTPDGSLYVQTDDNARGEHSTMTGTIWQIDLGSGEATPIIEDIGRPRGMLMLPSGKLVLSDHMHHVIRLLDPHTASLTPLAGVFDQSGSANGNGATARFDQPYGLALMPDGAIAVAEFAGRRIRRVTPSGEVTTLAGSGAQGKLDGPAASATFGSPQDLAIDASGAIYVADTLNFVIRRIANGTVDTVVGDGRSGYVDSADLAAAEIFGLEGLEVSRHDGLLYVADGSRGDGANLHHRIRSARLPTP